MRVHFGIAVLFKRFWPFVIQSRWWFPAVALHQRRHATVMVSQRMKAGTNALSGTTDATPKKIGEMTEFKKRKRRSTRSLFLRHLRHSRR
jgi:hypothetical protein